MTSPGRPDRLGLGIGILSVFGLPPIELVNLAVQRMPLVPLGYPADVQLG